MEKYFKIITLYVVVIIIFLAFFRFFLQGKELLQEIRNIDILYLVPQLFLAFFFISTTAYVNAIILRSFNIDLEVKEWFGLGCINALSNFIFPMKIGTMVKALYLKNKYGFRIAHSLSILFFATFIRFEVDLFLAALLLTYSKLASLFINPYLNNLLYFACLIFPIGIIFLMVLAKINLVSNFKNTISNMIINRLILLIDGMKLISKNVKLLVMITSLDMVIFIIQTLGLYFAYMAINRPTTLFNVAFVSLITSLSELLSLTPSNLGIKEVVISFSSKAIGCTIEEGFIVAAIIRIATMAHFLTFGTIFSIILRKDLSGQVNRKTL